MWPDCANDPEGLALLAAAVAHPTEDTPRLVLADWLQERGEEVVAGVLRASIRTRARCNLPREVADRWSPVK